MPPPTGPGQHALTARNLVFGTAHFFVLPVPPPWELIRGPFAPEVDRWVRRGGEAWVTEGRAAYLLYERRTGRGVELHIAVSGASARGGAAGERPPGRDRRVHVIGGHAASGALDEIRRGLWPRRRLHRLRVGFDCRPLARRIALELIGAYGPDLLLGLLDDLAGVRCH